MNAYERHLEERKALKRFVEKKSREDCIGFMAVLVERIEEIDKQELNAEVSFN